MNEFARAAGFRSLSEQKRKLSNTIKTASENADAKKILFSSDDKKTLECFRYCGKNFGFTIYNKTNSENVMKIRRWEVFAESKSNILLNDIYVGKGTNGHLYAFCEEYNTGGEFEFRLNNVLEYKKKWRGYMRTNSTFKVNIAGLASCGTIILPVEKGEQSHILRVQEEEEHKELLDRARKGDTGAEEMINVRANEMTQMVHERLKTEDVLSIFDAYILPVGNENGVFAVLGNILDIETDVNDITGENVLHLTIDSINEELSIFVNEADVVGMPMKGMRFMGVCKLQGSIIFETDTP